MPIYIDVLVVLNIFINYFILLCASKLSAVPANGKRLVFACIIGGLFSVIIILPPVGTALNILIKASVSLAVTAAAFSFHTFRQFLRCFASFLTVNFAFAGIMTALWFTLKPEKMALNNGTVYFDIGIPFFVFASVACYGIVSLIVFLTKRHSPDNKIYTISVSIENKTAVMKALLDTGNSLCDSFTSKPVTTVEFSSIKWILPKDFLTENADLFWLARSGVIPINTVSGNTLLKTVRADRMVITDRKTRVEIDKPIIAISESPLSDGEYTALLNAEILEWGEKNENEDKTAITVK